MEPVRRPNLAERALFAVLRVLLFPVAVVRPAGGWAQLYRRLCALEEPGGDPGAPLPTRRRDDRPPLVPMAAFCVLIAAAAAIWIWDIIHEPPPEPAAIHSTTR